MNIDNGNVDSKNAVGMLRLLENNTSLGELDLSGNSHLAEGDGEAKCCALKRLLNVNRTLKILDLSGCGVTDAIAKHILTGLTRNTSLVSLDLGSCKLSVSCSVSLFQHMITHTLSWIPVGVNIPGVGEVKMDRGVMCYKRHNFWALCGVLQSFKPQCHEGLKAECTRSLRPNC